ncbi:MAG: DNA polymerase IV [Bacilli bacterium]
MRIIFHIDVNNAFLSWSSVDLLKNGSKIDYRTVPSIISYSNGKNGIVLAKSESAKKLGIVTPELVYSAKKKCPTLHIIKPNYDLYEKYSKDLMTYLLKFTNEMQQYSIDECFIELTNTNYLYKDFFKLAYTIKEEIFQKFGFTVNVGIGNNKLLAKMASELEKPNKVCSILINEIEEKMHPLPIGKLFMVGKKTEELLISKGIKTIEDLANSDINQIISYLGIFGKTIHNYANGIDDSKVMPYIPKNKSISLENSLKFKNIEQIKNILYNQSSELGRKLRISKEYAYVINVYIKDNSFKRKSIQTTLRIPINTNIDIYNNAVVLYKKLKIEDDIRLIGIKLTNLTKKRQIQLSLFDDIEKYNSNNGLQKLVDDINTKFGNNFIKIGLKD